MNAIFSFIKGHLELVIGTILIPLILGLFKLLYYFHNLKMEKLDRLKHDVISLLDLTSKKRNEVQLEIADLIRKNGMYTSMMDCAKKREEKINKDMETMERILKDIDISKRKKEIDEYRKIKLNLEIYYHSH